MRYGQTREIHAKDAMRGDATRGPPPDASLARDPPQTPDAHEREIREALAALSRGAPEAMEHLVPLVYEELKGIAHRQLRAEAGGHTLSTTAVVHEAWLRLSAQSRAEWVGRGQFFAIAARTMRRVLVDYARRHDAARRGGPRRLVIALELLERVDAPAVTVSERAESLLALDEALEALQRMDDRLARVVECRFYAGLSEAETSEALGISHRTVARDWRVARAWLHDVLQDDAC